MSKAARKAPRLLEQQFDDTAFRLTQERNDFLLPQIIDFVSKDKWLNIRPEYQRRLVWSDTRKSLFIESLLLNVPIPPVFLYEWDLGRYEVMDGQQRLNAIVSFYDNGFALTGLDKWRDLNGLRSGKICLTCYNEASTGAVYLLLPYLSTGRRVRVLTLRKAILGNSCSSA